MGGSPISRALSEDRDTTLYDMKMCTKVRCVFNDGREAAVKGIRFLRVLTTSVVLLAVLPITVLGGSVPRADQGSPFTVQASAPSPASQAIPILNAPRFISVFTWNYWYVPFPFAQEGILAKYAFSDVNRSAYMDDLMRNTWRVLKSINRTHEVYLYELSGQTKNDQDAKPVKDVNSINRWNNARGLAAGSLNKENCDLFLLDSRGNRISDSYGAWYLDHGSQKLVDYWVAAVTADIIMQPWKGDGIFIDGPGLEVPSSLSGIPVKYSTNAAWSTASVRFMEAVSAALHSLGTKVWFNAGPTKTSVGKSVWLTMDASPNHPDILMDEGAFAVAWSRPGTLVGFYNEIECKTSIDTMRYVRNINIAMASHSKGKPGDTGVDNFGKQVSYWDAFYFALSCFLLGKNTAANNSYFSWHDDGHAVQWFEEYDIDLGPAKGAYQITRYGASNIYWREYEKGYAYVNLSNSDVTGIVLGDVCRRITHNNIQSPFDDFLIHTLDLPAHRAAILLKASVNRWS